MALIHCIECGKQVSSMASACPHCGFPIHPRESEPLYRAYRRRLLIGNSIIGAVAILAGLVLQIWVVAAMGVLALVIGMVKLRRSTAHDEERR